MAKTKPLTKQEFLEAMYTTMKMLIRFKNPLFLIKQIIEAHRGTIEVESTYGRGTKFTITLPLATKEQIESSANSDSIRETPKHET